MLNQSILYKKPKENYTFLLDWKLVCISEQRQIAGQQIIPLHLPHMRDNIIERDYAQVILPADRTYDTPTAAYLQAY